jgi:hypothetical protein
MSQSAKPTISITITSSFEDDYYNRLAEKGILEYGLQIILSTKKWYRTLMVKFQPY